MVGMAMRAKDCGVRERAWFAVALPTMHLAWGSGFLRGLVTGGVLSPDFIPQWHTLHWEKIFDLHHILHHAEKLAGRSRPVVAGTVFEQRV